MRKIDPETTQRILEAADIVEVVSDFVSLKRRGANYIGLCPFHSERTPSFSVSKSRGICKCFSCGKGGSPVNFLMELESMTFQEALRWLAKKYNIEIKEREVSNEERQAEAKRESMLAVNDFAMKFFEDHMWNTDEGRDVGLSYFRERGINDEMARKFHLGFSPERSNALSEAARKQGFSEEYLLATGLCSKNDRGIYDRFRARVMYPVFSLSGRVVAFGGRTLRSDKSVAKYVNSPESEIYSKSRELYGMYQARQAITRADQCILVEGYMDVISMHQKGVENVVASSGTSLTEQQIVVIRRFTNNVTVIYDSDPAGIKASLRGIDMLLQAGMNIKVLLLPQGDDPDSFAQSHSTEEIKEYIHDNEADFIRFKSDVMLKDAGDDPIRRADAVTAILKSVSVIPDPIKRQTYLDLCARMFQMDVRMLGKQIAKYIADHNEEEFKEAQRRAARERHEEIEKKEQKQTEPTATQRGTSLETRKNLYLRPFERELMRYAVRYGLLWLCDVYEDSEDESGSPMSVIEYIQNELDVDHTTITDAGINKLWNRISQIAATDWPAHSDTVVASVEKRLQQERESRLEVIRKVAVDLSDIQKKESLMNKELEEKRKEFTDAAIRSYLERLLCSDPDDDIRQLATALCDDKYTLSKVHTKYTKVETERERLTELVPRAIYELKNAILTCRITDVQQRLKDASESTVDEATMRNILTELMELNKIKGEFAHYLGERIITPGGLR